MHKILTVGIIVSGENRPESYNTCYGKVSLAHVRGLLRRELTPAIVARFTTKYQTSDACWLWTAGKYAGGYGMFHLWRDRDGRQRIDSAHRISYALHCGDVPAGAVVMHSCDVRACVNPAHLSLGTQRDNIRDAAAKGRLSVNALRRQKVTDAQIVELRQSSESTYELASRYGVSPAFVSLVRNNKRRKAA
jgi:hypothetical protein